MEEEYRSCCFYLVSDSFGNGCLGEGLATQSLGLVPRLGLKWLRIFILLLICHVWRELPAQKAITEHWEFFHCSFAQNKFKHDHPFCPFSRAWAGSSLRLFWLNCHEGRAFSISTSSRSSTPFQPVGRCSHLKSFPWIMNDEPGALQRYCVGK